MRHPTCTRRRPLASWSRGVRPSSPALTLPLLVALLSLVPLLAACGSGGSNPPSDLPDAVSADLGPVPDDGPDTDPGQDVPRDMDAIDDAESPQDTQPDTPDIDPDAGEDPDAGHDAQPDVPDPVPACNGSPDLCARPYDFAVFATTHNAMSNAEDGWVGANQTWSVVHQLDAGVRALMLDLHLWDNDETEPESPWLCHGECLFGNRRLSEALEELRDWLHANPREVVTLILENYVPGADVIAAFQEAGLEPLLHAQTPGAPWPTLGRMIEEDRRLVVLSDALKGGNAPWFLPVWTYAWETHWSAKTPSDLNCAPNRGDTDNDLFVLNHFLTDPLAFPRLAEQVNYNPFLIDRAIACRADSGRQPNFVTVDFCDIGDVFDAVATLNATPWHARDDQLRLDQIQVRGTHNSYHIAPDPLPPTVPQWGYTMAPLDVQLQQQAVRQVELDIHAGPNGDFEVYHIPAIDAGTTCLSFAECLALMKHWSDAHPWHVPLMVLIEPKDDIDDEKLDDRYDDIDAAIRAAWPEDRLLTPDDVRGEYATLRERLEADGWPTLGEVRGMAMFVLLDEGTHRTNYLAEHPNLEGRAMWARGGMGQPWGAILEYGNPVRDEAKIVDAVAAGYLVRTSAGDAGDPPEKGLQQIEAAIRLGAHYISTDFPVAATPGGYQIALPDGAPANCNPATTAGMTPPCRSGDVE